MSMNYPDYSLSGEDARKAMEMGLVDATWYKCPVPKEELLNLLERKDGPAIRDTLIWFALLIGSGIAGFLLLGTGWAVIPFFVYGTLYGTACDSRWHECNHGTAFKSDWMNRVVYELASFMVVRESVLWRWTHIRHHSDTLVTGSDPEIAAKRPPRFSDHVLNMFNLRVWWVYLINVSPHFMGKLTDDDKNLVPPSEFEKLFLGARLIVLIYAIVIGLAIYLNSLLPFLYVGLPSIYGAWLMPLYSLTQHSGLKENVLDHRENCRTVYMNRVNRFIYWNMNYHLEHHMFPLVPYHALPKLHELIRHDCPAPYHSLLKAWKEIIPAWRKQKKDPSYFVEIDMPANRQKKIAVKSDHIAGDNNRIENNWILVCSADSMLKSAITRFDYKQNMYSIYRTTKDEFYATDGLCSHGNSDLSEGMLVENVVECAKHNGRFRINDGFPLRRPVCVAINTYQVKVEDGQLWLSLDAIKRVEKSKNSEALTFRVVSNNNLTAFIKELVLESVNDLINYTPGDYLQIEIPPYDISYDDMVISESYIDTWKTNRFFDLHVENTITTMRNYSIATNPGIDTLLKFNIRIRLPPPGTSYSAGIGSSYAFQLKTGDMVTAYGPFGDFHIKPPEENEIIYIGGGAGMGPIRSHISYLFETEITNRKVSYWFGARSTQDLYYTEYLESLSKRFDNFNFSVALSDPLTPEDHRRTTGFIHEVFEKDYLATSKDFENVNFFLCGPPAMIEATMVVLGKYNVRNNQITYDEF